MTDFTEHRHALATAIAESSQKSADALDLLTRDIDASKDRLQTIRTRISERVPMKYALESIPSFIGEQDFRDLCRAVGFADGEHVTGKDLAEAVRQHVLTSDRKAEQSREKLRQAGLV